MDNLFKVPLIFSSICIIVIYNSCQSDLPIVTTSGVTNITEVSAVSGGNVIDDGGADVTVRGICWNTSENPSTSNNPTFDGVGLGTFTSNLTQLTPGTKYYLRAYATNEAGTGYSGQEVFTSSALKDLYIIDVHNETSWDYWQSNLLFTSVFQLRQ